MITAQDIREKGFERVRLNGYDMAAVDESLEELADDVAASQKENAVLKSKMKVLVDKIEEYRKLAVQIENEARQRAAATVAEADKKAQETIGSIAARADAEEKRLADAKAACAKFFEAAKVLCNTQLEKIDAIRTDMGVQAPKAPAPAEKVDDAVRAIESSASRMQTELSLDLDADVKPRSRKLENTQPFTL